MSRGRECTGSPLAPSFKGLQSASEAASWAKQANRKQDTAHEVLLRRELWRMGLRYRKNVGGLPGKPDVVFTRAGVVVFCDGDFWHGRDWERLQAALARRHNAAYWLAKIGRNMQRDKENDAALRKRSWLVIRLWETDIKRDAQSAAQRIRRIVEQRLHRKIVAKREARRGRGLPLVGAAPAGDENVRLN
jgi:DNA mismatch endonuclease (patch repair protein)